MTILSVIVSIALLSIAALHLAWAAGSRFPAASDENLAHMVAGFRGQDRMPPRSASALVAAMLGLASYLALALSSLVAWPLGARLLAAAGALLALVFLARGAATYTGRWRTLTPQEPFATLDRRYFGPLSLLLGAGFVLLTTGYAA
ncbi:MAG TPA: DUF3995 domain-containing protein [Rhizobium sp.]|nr:DUF3995 domain-containing protein [Rhizobium sp.]